MLEFGTAGLRGALGAGPNRMNRAVVLRAAAGLTAYLLERTDRPLVVVGYDARHNSDVSRVTPRPSWWPPVAAALLLPRPLPTPVLAFAIRHLGADAGVMVTASHNPPQDNGYKVYLGDGSQIVPPADSDIAAHIDRVDRVADIARADDGWEVLGEQVVQDYLAAATAVVDPHGPRELTMVHTSLHGVGNEVVQRAFAARRVRRPGAWSRASRSPTRRSRRSPSPTPRSRARSTPRWRSPRRWAPTWSWPTTPTPTGVPPPCPTPPRSATPTPAAGGCCAATRSAPCSGRTSWPAGWTPDAVFANSIVSSRLLAALAHAAGVRHEETLTGFKWIARVPGLRYGYEEALGYCVDPRSVQDKDGVSAALLLAEMAAGLRAQGRTLLDVLDDLAVAHGLHATDAFSVRVADLALIATVMERLRSTPPGQVGGVPVTRVDDLAQGSPDLPPTDGLRYHLADGSRVIVRPSGTEPKLKAYLEVIVPVAGRRRPAGGTGRGRGSAGPHPRRDDGAHRPLTHGRTAAGSGSAPARPRSRLGRARPDQGEEDDRQERQDEREHGLRDPAGRDRRGRRGLDLARGDRGGVLRARVLDRVRDRTGGDLGGLGRGGAGSPSRVAARRSWSSLVLMPGRRLEAPLGRSTCEEIAQAVQPSSPAHTLTFQRASHVGHQRPGDRAPRARCCSAGRRPG